MLCLVDKSNRKPTGEATATTGEASANQIITRLRQIGLVSSLLIAHRRRRRILYSGRLQVMNLLQSALHLKKISRYNEDL
jgi:hypothetical protein